MADNTNSCLEENIDDNIELCMPLSLSLRTPTLVSLTWTEASHIAAAR